MDKFRTFVVEVPDVADARLQFAEAMLTAGENMFIVPLYDAGGTITHYISTGWLDEKFADMLPLHDPIATPYDPDPVPYNGAPVQWRATIQTNGFPINTGEVAKMFNSLDVTTQDPHQRIAGLGLSLEPS